MEEITNELDFVKTEKTKDIIKRIKREATDRLKIFAKDRSGKGSVCIIPRTLKTQQ